MTRPLLALCLLAALGSAAHAQERSDSEPAGTVVTHPQPRSDCTADDGCDGRTVTRAVDHWALPRPMAERALTERELSQRRLNGWLECEARAERLVNRPGGKWFDGIKTAGKTAGIVAIFALGVWTGSKL